MVAVTVGGRNFLAEGPGRAKEAVEEIMGVARDDDTTAGTEVDLIIFARRAVSSARLTSVAAPLS